jgi:sodium transport system permease protein
MAYVVYKTGSIFLSMIMHFCNNAIAMVVSVYPDAIFKILPFTSNIKMTPINMSLFVCFGIIVLVLGIFILKFDNRMKNKGDKN